jgi:phage terminase large subunit-like protein
VWEENGGAPIEDFAGLPVYAGLDLSETSDLTALVMIAPKDGLWHVKPIFWLPAVGLAEKARKDKVEYDVWADRGLIETTPGKAIQYEYVAERLRALFDRLDIRRVAFDRFNWRHLKPWLEKAGFSEEELGRFVEFGQGFVSMSPALRETESLLLSGRYRHGMHPVLTMCAANAVVRSDPAGNRKLDKARSRGRIDGMICLPMATSVATTAEQEERSIYETMSDETAAALGLQEPAERAQSGADPARSDAIDRAILADPRHPRFEEMRQRYNEQLALLDEDEF